MENNELEKGIEAVLFWKGEPISIKKLSQIFENTFGNLNEKDIRVSLRI